MITVYVHTCIRSQSILYLGPMGRIYIYNNNIGIGAVSRINDSVVSLAGLGFLPYTPISG